MQDVIKTVTSAKSIQEATDYGVIFQNGVTLAQFPRPRLILPTGFVSANGFGFQIVSDQAVTVTVRTYTAGRKVFIDIYTLVLVANVPNSLISTNLLFIGSETEILITNSSGSPATITATVIVR